MSDGREPAQGSATLGAGGVGNHKPGPISIYITAPWRKRSGTGALLRGQQRLPHLPGPSNKLSTTVRKGGNYSRCPVLFYAKIRWRRSSLHRSHDSHRECKSKVARLGGGDITNGDGQQEPKVDGMNTGAFREEAIEEITV